LKKTINGVSTEFGDAFRKLGPIPTMVKPDPANDKSTVYLQKNQVVVNWYPKIQAMKSSGVQGGDGDAAPNQTHLTAKHIAFLDMDRLYFDLERFKAERGWHNLNITGEGLLPLLTNQSWYQLLIPAEELAFDSFEKVDLSEDDPNFLGSRDESGSGYYRFLIERSEEEIIAKLEILKTSIANGSLLPWEFQGLKALWFDRHLYQPLLYMDSNVVEISPVPLNKGERRFVEDIKAYHDNSHEFFANKELYLLRNLSKGRGVGFFEAGNFHPDFIVWLLVDGQQYVIFVDPKGIRNLGQTDPKIQFHSTIKEIQHRLGDSSVRLESFIISNTPSHTMRMLWTIDKTQMQAFHILFQEEDKDTYIESMLKMVGVD